MLVGVCVVVSENFKSYLGLGLHKKLHYFLLFWRVECILQLQPVLRGRSNTRAARSLKEKKLIPVFLLIFQKIKAKFTGSLHS